MTDLPIACSLRAADLETRLSDIAALGADSLVAHAVDGSHRLLRFRADPGIRDRLEAIVAAESRCCPFLELELTAADGLLLLSIAAPPEAQAVADELALAFIGDAGGPRPARR